VFQCHNEAANASQFLKTIEALSEYINKNMSFPKDLASLCEDHSVSELNEPKDLSAEEEKSKTKTLIWETKVKAYVKRCDEQEKNLRAIFSVVWGQCSTAMQSKLQSLDGYNEKKTECDCSWILKEIKGITHRFEGTRYVFLSINEARTNFYSYKQKSNETLTQYLEHFRSLVEVLEHYGANIGEDEAFIEEAEKLIDEFPPDVNDCEDYKTYLVKVAVYRDKCKKAARNRTLALAFLKGADRRLYGNLWVELENQFTRQHDQYPIDITAAYNMLLNYKSTAPVQGTDEGEALGGLSFVQRGGVTVPGSDGITHARITCYACLVRPVKSSFQQ